MEAGESCDVGHCGQGSFYENTKGKGIRVLFPSGMAVSTTLVWEDEYTIFVKGGGFGEGALLYKHAIQGISLLEE